MNKEENLKRLMQCHENEERIKETSELYGTEVCGIVAKIISFSDNVDFIEEERRALTYNEIINASKEYGKDFKSLGIIPLIDAYDNDLIVYIIGEKTWAKYSLSDDILFKKRDKLEELL